MIVRARCSLLARCEEVLWKASGRRSQRRYWSCVGSGEPQPTGSTPQLYWGVYSRRRLYTGGLEACGEFGTMGLESSLQVGAARGSLWSVTSGAPHPGGFAWHTEVLLMAHSLLSSAARGTGFGCFAAVCRTTRQRRLEFCSRRVGEKLSWHIDAARCSERIPPKIWTARDHMSLGARSEGCKASVSCCVVLGRRPLGQQAIHPMRPRMRRAVLTVCPPRCRLSSGAETWKKARRAPVRGDGPSRPRVGIAPRSRRRLARPIQRGRPP